MANATRLRIAGLRVDARHVHEAALALERNGAPARLVSDIRKRRDEWEDQADEMERRLADTEGPKPANDQVNG